MSTAKTVLYSAPNSRGAVVEWYLRLLKAPVEVVNLDMAKGEHKSPEYLRVNPFGKVPALAEIGPEPWSLYESGAILLYLAEKHDPTFPKDLRKRAEIAQWILFANSTLSQTAFVESLREKQLPGLLASLDQHFSKHPFVMGDAFSVADVAVGSYLAYIPMFLAGKVDMSPYPHVNNYIERVKERQAMAKA
jgi:glutathione S-transferase